VAKLLGPYRLGTRIGTGGMGEVFRAVDTRLDRSVAIKVLNEAYVGDEARQRFAREARAASALNHPHICTVHDVGESDGQPYLVMELLEGETLQRRLERGLLPLADLLTIGAELADALEFAHAHGIVHRDIKPANVFITARQQAKLMDFGIAKMVGGAVDEADPTRIGTGGLTEVGAAVGTIGYMSPEQARGQTLDARTDIFSLGVTLYEMASGARPFAGSTAPLIYDAILNREPAPVRTIRPDIPAAFESIITDTLVKDRNRRLQTAHELRARLLALGRAGTVQDAAASPRTSRLRPKRAVLVAAAALVALAIAAGVLWRPAGLATPLRSLAILPFDDSGAGDAREALQGLNASLADELARHGELTVIAGAATAPFAGTREATTVAGALNADAVLSATASLSGNRVRLEASVARAGGSPVWAQSYERPRSELFDLQKALAGDVARALGLSASSSAAGTRPNPQRPADPAAYDLYLRAKYHAGRWNATELDGAIDLAEKAAALDPGFAPAQALLGMFYGTKAFNFRPNDPDLRAKGYSAIQKALAIDPDSAEAHFARGILIWQPTEGFPHRGALNEYRLALKRQPNMDDAWHHRGVVLMHIGHLEQAGEFYQRAVTLNPANTLARFRFAPLLNYQSKYDDALTVLRRVPRDIYPSQWTYHMGWSLVTLGRMREAAEEIDKALSNTKTDQGGVIHATRALLRAKNGDRRGAEADIAAAIEFGQGFGHFHHTALTIGEVYSVLGDLDRAQEWVEKAANDGFPNYSFFEVDPHLASLRATDRFRRFLQQLRSEWEHIEGE